MTIIKGNFPRGHKPALMIETKRGPVELPMLVGALLRGTEVKTIGRRPPLRSHGHVSTWPKFLGDKP